MENVRIDTSQDLTDDRHDGEYLIRKVYAYFGRAYYFSECVYRGLVQVLATAGEGLTRPRIEERFKALEQKTL